MSDKPFEGYEAEFDGRKYVVYKEETLEPMVSWYIKQGLKTSRLSTPKGHCTAFTVSKVRHIVSESILPGIKWDTIEDFKEKVADFRRRIRPIMSNPPLSIYTLASKLLGGVKKNSTLWTPPSRSSRDKVHMSSSGRMSWESLRAGMKIIMRWFVENQPLQFWDKQSSYPSTALKFGLPGMAPQWCNKNYSTRHREGKIVFADAKVSVPSHLDVGPLPVKMKGIGSSYPVGGIIEGVYTLDELQYAYYKGCDIEVRKAVYYTPDYSFSRVLGFLLEERAKEHEFSKVFKLIANIICGKLGQKPVRNQVSHKPKNTSASEGWKGFGDPRIELYQRTRVTKPHPWTCAHALGYIVSQTRIEMQEVIDDNRDIMVFALIDGIATTATPKNIPEGWRKKEEFDRRNIVVPYHGAYFYFDPERPEETFSSQAPGIPKNLMPGEVVEMKVNRGLGHYNSDNYHGVRRVQGIEKRIAFKDRTPLPDGRTMPLNLTDLQPRKNRQQRQISFLFKEDRRR